MGVQGRQLDLMVFSSLNDSMIFKERASGLHAGGQAMEASWHPQGFCSSASVKNPTPTNQSEFPPCSHRYFPAPELVPSPPDLSHPLCSPAPHLQFGKGPQLEELLHPELEVEAEAVDQGPDVNDLTGPQPQCGDGKGGNAGHQFLQDVVVVLPNVVIHIPKKPRKVVGAPSSPGDTSGVSSPKLLTDRSVQNIPVKQEGCSGSF